MSEYIKFRGSVYRQVAALVLVHVDSIETVVNAFGWRYANPIEEELKRTAASFNGHCVVITQGWESDRARKIIEAAKSNPNGSVVIKFDEATQAWGPFLSKLNKVLHVLAASTVEVGGFWWDDTSGCARHVYQYLTSKGYKVDKSSSLYSLDELEEEYYA